MVTRLEQIRPTGEIDKLAGNEPLMEACQQFEALLWGQVLKAMHRSVPEDGVLPQSNERQLFQEMLDDQYAVAISQTGSLGLAHTLYTQTQAGLAPALHERTALGGER